MKSVELFAGAGGLGMGLSLAGFEPSILIERDKWCCDTIEENQRRDHPLVRDWRLFRESDAHTFDYEAHLDGLRGDIDLVSGGPPCQPFSIGGKHRAHKDERDMFPVAVDVVRRLRPRAFIFENVKGITRSTFTNYLSYIVLQLSFPDVVKRDGETWPEHLKRLEEYQTRGLKDGLTYNVVPPKLLNAADYGVPQRRERVFIVGFRSDQYCEWSFPMATHSREALLFDQWISGDYWDRHGVGAKDRPPRPRLQEVRTRQPGQRDLFASVKPWRTVRDALIGLPDPRADQAEVLFPNHRHQPGARPYPGHTGSPLDLPAKTLKAGDHGVPGGENMLVMPSGEVRYFTIRESARLQTFPDDYILHGTWSEAMRQLGNAVPVTLAWVVGASVAKRLIEKTGEEQRSYLDG
jgi:DNA (cytosine-5)-methyltransferase 1